jgi:cell division protein ZapA (FtsZ GTPase activity inhibitor)
MSDTHSTRVGVDIYGKTFTFSLDQGQTAEHVRQAAQLVDEKMRKPHEVHPAQSPYQATVLVGLNLVDELFKLQAEYQNAESDIAQRTSRLSASLGRAFQNSGPDSTTSGTS